MSWFFKVFGVGRLFYGVMFFGSIIVVGRNVLGRFSVFDRYVV